MFPSVQPIQDQIKHDAGTLGINATQLAAIKGITRWRDTLLEQDGSTDQAARFNFLRWMGYVGPKTPIVSADTSMIRQVSGELIDRAANDPRFAALMIEAPYSSWYPKKTGSSKAVCLLLQNIVRHESSYDRVSFPALRSIFPFPIEALNLFGRFIAGNTCTPLQASRHLQLAAPFFSSMKILLEGLVSERLRYFIIDIDGYVDSEFNFSTINGKKQLAHQRRLNPIHNLVLTCVESAHELVSSRESHRYQCKVIFLPDHPKVNIDHIKSNERADLAAEFFDWLFLNKQPGALMTRKALSVTEEAQVESLSEGVALKQHELKLVQNELADLPTVEREGAKTTKKEKRAPTSRAEELNQKIRKLEADIANTTAVLGEFADKRKHAESIVQQLLQGPYYEEALKGFQDEVQRAIKNNKQMVFSGLHREVDRGDIFFCLFDHAFTSRKTTHHEGVEIVKRASFLFTLEEEQHLKYHRAHGSEAITEGTLRTLTIHANELQESAFRIAEGMERKQDKVPLRSFVSGLFKFVCPPGISSETQLRQLVKESTAESPHRLSAMDYALFVLERIPFLGTDTLNTLYALLAIQGVRELPPRFRQLVTERFHLDPKTCELYELFQKKFRPDQIGSLSDMFRELTTLDAFFTEGLQSFGMKPELTLLQEKLVQSGIVNIVDSTNYHPDLATSAQGVRIESGVEATNDITGSYVRPTERLVRALIRSIMEGSCAPPLRHCSVVEVAKPEVSDLVYEALVKSFHGVDLGLSPDIAGINEVLGNLMVYDEHAVLVIDATAVKDLEKYRAFIDRIRDFGIKLIIRSREAIPGIPNVFIQPFAASKLPERVKSEQQALVARLGLTTFLTDAELKILTERIDTQRGVSQDPVNLMLQTISLAAQVARLDGRGEITTRYLNDALATVFHTPNPEKIALLVEAVNEFAREAPRKVLGQPGAIQKLAHLVIGHLLRLGDPTRPLVTFLLGPTGVGKTELAFRLAKAANFPFLAIDGGAYKDETSFSRLSGSEPKYKGDDHGILFDFLLKHEMGMVFIDEVEKMHPNVIIGLMNFLDKGLMTGGDGKEVTRPGYIIVLGSNAGAQFLTPGMSEREIRTILSEHFKDQDGQPKPELIARVTPIMMPAIKREDFNDVVRECLFNVAMREGVLYAGIQLEGVTETAVSLLFERAKEVCQRRDTELKIGFRDDSSIGESQGDFERFNDMRYVGRALADLLHTSLSNLVIDRYTQRTTGHQLSVWITTSEDGEMLEVTTEKPVVVEIHQVRIGEPAGNAAQGV